MPDAGVLGQKSGQTYGAFERHMLLLAEQLMRKAILHLSIGFELCHCNVSHHAYWVTGHNCAKYLLNPALCF